MPLRKRVGGSAAGDPRPRVAVIGQPYHSPVSLRWAPLVGRDEDIERIRGFLSAWGGCVMFGAGGIGKTSVAVTVGAGFETVEWIDAESFDLVGAVNTALLDRLDPLPLADRAPALQSLLEGGRVLVVIDGAEGSREELSELIRAFPRPRAVRGCSSPAVFCPLMWTFPSYGSKPSTSMNSATRPRRALSFATGTWLQEAPEVLQHHTDEVQRLVVASGGIPGVLTLVASRAALVGFDSGDDGTEHRSTDAVFDTTVSRSLQLLDPDSAKLLLVMGAAADHVPRGLAAALSDLLADRLDAAIGVLAARSDQPGTVRPDDAATCTTQRATACRACGGPGRGPAWGRGAWFRAVGLP